MKKIPPSSQSAFLSPRVFLVLIFLLTGVSLALVGFGQNQKDETRAINRGVVDLHTIAGAPPPCAPPPVGMVAWWPADGNADDIIGGNNGTLQGGATFAAGKVDQVFSFNGTSAYVEIPDSTSVSITGQLTMDAWINPNNVSANQEIVSKYNSCGTEQRSYSIDVRAGGAVRFCVYNGQPDEYHCVETSTPVITPGVFSHVAGTFDPATQAMKIYVNGVDTNAPVLPGSVTVNPIFDSDTPVDIGRVFCAGSNDYFGGLIDEVELFNRVLSQAEIQAIVNADTSGKCKPRARPTPRPRPTPAPRPTP